MRILIDATALLLRSAGVNSYTYNWIRSLRQIPAHALRRAEGLIAVSENRRQDAIRILGIAPGKIQTIHSGVPDEYFTAQPFKRSRPYVLFVGTIEPRKNVETLLDAWSGMRFRDDFDLLIAGPPGWRSERVMSRLQSGISGVPYLGY